MKASIPAGKIQTLPVFEVADDGYLLGNEKSQVFISRRELKPNTEPGTEVEVFTFYNEDRVLEATTRLPDLQIGQVGCFRVGNSNDLGTFIKIGTRRDILIPKKEQIETLETGRMALVVLLEDQENRRLYASTKLQRHLRNPMSLPYKRGDQVQLTIAERIDIGRRVVVDGKYLAVLFQQEMMDRVRLGEKVVGFVRKVEGKDLTVSMQREGVELIEDSKKKLMDYLEANGGYVRLNDDTDPEEIKLRLHMSKKTFKKAAGGLFKDGKIILSKFGIKINRNPGEAPPPPPREEKKEPVMKPAVDRKRNDSVRPSSARTERPSREENRPRREDDRPRREFDDKKPTRDRSEEPRTDTPGKKRLTFKGRPS
ncbi:MAG: S1 RNA-binding domain-containing protein [Flavobacteriales bacterium]